MDHIAKSADEENRAKNKLNVCIKSICFQRHIQLPVLLRERTILPHDFHTFLLIQQFQDGIRVESLLSEFRISDHPEDE